MKTRKVLSVLLAVVMMLSVVSPTVYAVSGWDTEGNRISNDRQFVYRVLSDRTAEIISYRGVNTSTVTIPAEVDEFPVKSVGEIYKESSQFNKIIISSGITEIRKKAFYEMGIEIELPETLTYICSDAFYGTPYYNDESNWDNNVFYMGNYLICSRSGLPAQYTVRDGTTLIANKAFYECEGLEEISLPASLKHINVVAFYGCTALKSIELPNGITEIEDSCFRICTSLESINIPQSVNAIGEWAFAGCSSLNNLSVPQSVISVGEHAFINTAYFDDEENWENGVLYLGDILLAVGSDFSGDLEIKENTRLIADSAAFYNGNITSVNIPGTVSVIGSHAFGYCTGLKEIVFEEGVSSVSNSCFQSCNALESVTLPSTLETIEDNAFVSCVKLEECIFNDGLVEIGAYSFYDCTKLKTVKIPLSVETIGVSAFAFLSEEEQREYSYLDCVYGYGDTVAEQFCNHCGIMFVALDCFPDVSDDAWFNEAVKYNAQKGFITGYKNGNFGPADKLQRQDFIVILARIEGADLDSQTECALGDIDMSAYYGKSVAWAVGEGIIKGYDSGLFGVGDSITREQVATILYRYSGSPEIDDADAILSSFPDAATVSDFAKDAMAWAVQNSIISGKNGKLAPTATASRAEIATIVMRMDKQGMFD